MAYTRRSQGQDRAPLPTDSSAPPISPLSLAFTLNGRPVRVTPRPGESLLEVLRDRCGIRSTKDGCSPQGQCGACLALVGGRPLVTCAMAAEKADGKEVVTLEGLPPDERARLAEAFAATGAVQCGFCTPGIVLRTKALLDGNPQPLERETIARGIDTHLCRCTGYTKVFDAIERLDHQRRGEPVAVPESGAGVGARHERYRARELALGDQPFVADLTREGMLFGALKLSDHPRARVIGIDIARALAHPGVVSIVTAADVPGERWYGLIEKDL